MKISKKKTLKSLKGPDHSKPVLRYGYFSTEYNSRNEYKVLNVILVQQINENRNLKIEINFCIYLYKFFTIHSWRHNIIIYNIFMLHDPMKLGALSSLSFFPQVNLSTSYLVSAHTYINQAH